jgi:quercetin 2,3-dioxygenase
MALVVRHGTISKIQPVQAAELWRKPNMKVNELPGTREPYKIEAGQGPRLSFGSQTANILGRPEDLGQPMFGAVLSGAKGSGFPLHKHERTHEAWFVLEGKISILLGKRRYVLTPGCYVNIPPGIPHSFTYEEHRSRVLTWLFQGDAHVAFEKIGAPFNGSVYPETDARVDWARLGPDEDFTWLEAASGEPTEPGETLPKGAEAFVLGAYEGERMLAAEQLYTFLGTQEHSSGSFISLLTEGPVGPEIPRHFHDRVTETFFCIKGQLQMFVEDGFQTLDAGDFLHIPPGAVHSFKLLREDTRFIGFLMPGHFENFFRYLCEPFSGHVYPLTPPPFSFARVIQHMNELDLHMVGRPGPPPAGAA